MEDWDDYRYFLAVVRNGSFSAAARAMNVSQPTVARHISELEKRLDVRLFDITAAGAILTESGRMIVECAESMEQLTKSLKHRPLDRMSDPSGLITVTATKTFSEFWLSERVSKFSALYPEICVQLNVTDSKLDVEKNEADVAIRFGRPNSLDLIASRVGSLEAGIYGSDSYFGSNGTPDCLDDLKDLSAVGAFGQLAKFPQVKKFSALLDPARIAVSTNCSKTYLELAKSGMGMIAVPSYAGEHSGQLRRILRKEFSFPLEIWMLSRSALMKTTRVRSFLDFVRCEMKQSFAGP